MNQQTVTAFLFSLSLGLSSYAAMGVAPAGAETATDEVAWVERIASAQAGLDRANRQYADAIRSYSQMRHRRSERGSRKAEVLDQQEQARSALTSATRTLEDTLEAARRAGVPPGWVREALARSAAPAEQAH
jgi:hypothetical protein